MNLDKLEHNYVSEADKFLNELRQRLPLSASQKAIIAKCARIAERRDNPDAAKDSGVLPEDF